jgi:ABC-2 type transport system ATP-binding protein
MTVPAIEARGPESAKGVPAIEARGLTKRYGTAQALAGVDLLVQPGEVCGFLGPNGAGKSTTLRVLARVERPDAGFARIDGHDVLAEPNEAALASGYMPERFATYDALSVEEYLEFFLDLYLGAWPKDRPLPAARKVVRDALELVGMGAKANDAVGGLSKGQRQRILLARCVLHDPKVLLLDEPTSGLDPRARAEFKAIVRELSRMGKAVLISSHVLPDLEDLCGRIVILAAGKVHAAGLTEEIRSRMRAGSAEIEVELLDAAAAASALAAVSTFAGATGGRLEGSSVVFAFEGGRERLPELHRFLVGAGLPVVQLEYRRASLEELYLQLTADVSPESQP